MKITLQESLSNKSQEDEALKTVMFSRAISHMGSCVGEMRREEKLPLYRATDHLIAK